MARSPDLVDVATGVLMERYRQDVEEASAMLATMARSHGRDVAELAADLVAAPRTEHLGAASLTVSCAVSFIEANAHRDIGTAEIAAAVHIGARGLQQAFRKHRGQTPLGHLRQVRLERAHRDLLTADRSDRVTVGDIANRWHFANAGRFASEYRQAFGCSPSRTLRTPAVPGTPDFSALHRRAHDAVHRARDLHGRAVEASLRAVIAKARAEHLAISPVVEACLHLLAAQETAASPTQQPSTPRATTNGTVGPRVSR
ncbi:helix-turn-helix domain-containing protein [Actinomycetospora aeridis]|uniref:Helix-turn-helix domain-containing protein n=1 Tax=Actinomycetospora aeridis TaxID=3129231 RepID=A0ABU8N912_9PSEU